MPALPKSPCRKCGVATANRNGYCDKHQDNAVGWKRRQVGTTTTQRGYGAAWRAIRLSIIARDKQCVNCRDNGFISPIHCIDHVIPKWLGGTDSPDNLQGLCKPCHDEKTMQESKSSRDDCIGNDGRPVRHGLSRKVYNLVFPIGLKPSKPNLFIVCGPPGSGKTTWVNSRILPGDELICLDTIMSQIQGTAPHRFDRSRIGEGLVVRNNRLLQLSASKAQNAYFIVSCRDGDERRWWAEQLKPTKLILLNIGADECVKRIYNDPERQPVALKNKMIEAVHWWYKGFTD